MRNKINEEQSHTKLISDFSQLCLRLRVTADILFERENYKMSVYKTLNSQSK